MSKSDRILDLFPAFYRANDRGKLLNTVVRKLAQPVEESDTHLFRIQRSHRLLVAEHAEDIIRLAGMLNLTDFHFEDIVNDRSMAYPDKLTFMRERVRRIAGIHLKGLGTPWAIMECAAIFLNAGIVPQRTGDRLIQHLDKELFSHKAVIEFAHVSGKPRDRVVLHENPFIRKKVESVERWPMNSWFVTNHNFDHSSIKLAIQGIQDRTVLPSVFCPETEEGIVFNGIVPAGKMLVIDDVNGALLDNIPVDAWVTYFKGGINDFSKVDIGKVSLAEGKSSRPFDGDREKPTRTPIRRRKPVPVAPKGRSEWVFKVAEGVYGGTDFDYSVFADAHQPIGLYDGDNEFDQCVFDYPGSGVVGMAWNERVPCAFKLVLPKHRPFEPSQGTTSDGDEGDTGQPLNDISRIGNIISRFKAAGVQAYVDSARNAWILGESVLGSFSTAEAESMDQGETRLLHPDVDTYIPYD